MKKKYLRTSDVAKAAGCHANTVRLYETLGFLPPIPRTPGGYRQFTQAHADQMVLARMAMNTPYPGKTIRQSSTAVVKHAATGDLGGALEMAYAHVALVQSERAAAESAVRLLERWAQGTAADATIGPLRIGETAKLLGVTADMLRNWERNGLLVVPRDSNNGYRTYEAAEISRLRVIRMLIRAGYSIMAVLRMLVQLDGGDSDNLSVALDTPPPDEDVYTAADRWLSTLAAQEQRALDIIEHLEMMIQRQSRSGA